MKKTQIIAILGLIVQIGNASAAFSHLLPVDVALYVAASVGAIQAFLGEVQKGIKKKA